MIYRREIDGLRAVAVVAVIGFHAGFSAFRGGFVGVDIFFVISGYLITHILMDELEQRDFSILRFYERRARRILPMLFLVMLCCIPFAWQWMVPNELKDFSQSIAAVTLFASNVLFLREEGYFTAAAELKPLLHTWSLAVEEQFYLLLPPFLSVCWRFGRARLFWAFVVLATASLLLSEWGWRHNPEANFYLAPSRAWEFLAGSLCAFLHQMRPLTANNLASLTGLALIVFSIIFFDRAMPFPSVYALVPVVGSALVILFGVSGTLVAQLLGGRLFVGVGLISYSAYLWHQPLFAFARLGSAQEPSSGLMLALVGATFLLALSSWHYVEKPLRAFPATLLRSQRAAFMAMGVIGGAFLVLGLVGHATHGFKHLWLQRAPTSVATTYRLYAEARSKSAVYLAKNRKDDGDCIFNADKVDQAVRQRLDLCYRKHGPGILIFGDSHATGLFNGIAAMNNGRAAFLVGITKNGCHLPDYLPNCPYVGIYRLIRDQPHLFLAAVYEKAGITMFKEAYSLSGPGFGRSSESPAQGVYDRHVIAGVKSYLGKLSNFTHVIWFGPRIEPGISQRIALKFGCNYDFVPNREVIFLYKNMDKILKETTKDLNNFEFISQISKYKFSFPRDFMNCKKLYWIDESHYSSEGEILFAKRFDFLEYLTARHLIKSARKQRVPQS